MGIDVNGVRLVIVDLDNTLYDWLTYFGPAMRGLCSRLSELSGCPTQVLYQEFRDVFSRHGSVEYSFALQELPSLRRLHPNLSGPEIVNRYRGAIDIYQSRRRKYLQLYEGVARGLHELRSLGVTIFALSDAQRFHVVNRLKQLRVVDLLNGICCVADHEQDPDEVNKIRRFPAERYDTKLERELILPAGLRKPDKRVLDWLLEQLDVSPAEAVYVGDSLIKDIPMAKAAGVYDCWAIYGTHYSVVDMATLVRVTDWPPAAVAAAIDATPDGVGIRPSYIAHSFADVVKLVTKPRVEWAPRIEPSFIPRKQLPLFELAS